VLSLIAPRRGLKSPDLTAPVFPGRGFCLLISRILARRGV
jgi:hypothetical protein